MKEFYSPGEVHFTKQTVLWLLQNLGCLSSGSWPADASNYIDIPGKKVGNKAYYQTPIEYAAEIEERLEKCGIDGLILEAIESWGKTDESLARYFKMPVWSIRKRRKKALIYVSSGPNRRWHTTKKRKGETYQEFRDERRKNK